MAEELMTLNEAVARLRDAGVGLTVEFWAAGSNYRMSVPSDQFSDYLADPVAWAAGCHFGVERDQLERFRDSDAGKPVCSAMTKVGTRCTARVRDPRIDGTLEGFLAAEGGYCLRHGGED